MAAKKNTASGPKSADAAIPKRHPSQAFEAREMSRSELTTAEYNPRVMSDGARDRLRKGIGKIGLLQSVIWNKRTGTVVGGHQRLKVLDQLSDSKDYLLTVDVVDLSPKQEREANILLNSHEAQGEFDIEKLGEMFKFEGGLDLDSTGFAAKSIYEMFGDAGVMAVDGVAEQLADKLREGAQAVQNVHDGTHDRDNPNFYLVVTFRNQAEMLAFIEHYQLPDAVFQNGDLFRKVVPDGSQTGTDNES